MTQTFILPEKDRERLAGNLHAFVLACWPGKRVRVSVEQYRKTRSNDQNNALFGVAYGPLSEATGFTKDELHEAFCKRHFGTVDKEVMGVLVSKPYRTTTTGPDGKRDVISTTEFSDFYAAIQQVAAEAGVYIAEPDPLHGEKA